MSYDQSYRGEVAFSDRRRLEAGLDAFLRQLSRRHTTGFGLANLGLRWEERWVYLKYDVTASASFFDEVLSALRRLAEYADSGRFELTFDGATETVPWCGREPPTTPLEHQDMIDAFLKGQEAEHLAQVADDGY